MLNDLWVGTDKLVRAYVEVVVQSLCIFCNQMGDFKEALKQPLTTTLGRYETIQNIFEKYASQKLN
ncbi:hypothetical protein EMGBS4_08590 [Acidimicrobiaceae bacterium]|nr:hypothetical protein EMGBS4_08590 [Acidimicrobiaceae bacterium]